MAVSPQLLASLLRDPRMAQAQQAQQSAFAQPTSSPLQGLAQMLQQGLGGYMQRQVTNEYEQRSNKLGADKQKLFGALLSGDTEGAMAAAGANPDLADFGDKLAISGYESQLATKAKRAEQEGKVEQIDAGDRVILRNGLGQMIGEYSKAATPDATLAETGRNNRFEGVSGDARLQAGTSRANAQLQAATTMAGYTVPRLEAGYEWVSPGNPSAGARPVTGSKAASEATASAVQKEGAAASYQQALDSLNIIKTHPGKNAVVGLPNPLQGKLPMVSVPGSPAAGFEAQLETFKSQLFLPMVQQLKGMGALSNAEGEKLTAAAGALSTKMSEAEFNTSVERLERDLNAAKMRVGGGAFTPAGNTGATGGWDARELP